MKKTLLLSLILIIPLFMSGCTPIDEISLSMSSIYASTTIASLCLLIFYIITLKDKDYWFILLFSSVFIVNLGYFTLSIAHTLDHALLANRISYFGSVFLPFSMLMIILNALNINVKKWMTWTLLALCCIVFTIAASPGYSQIYYQEVTLATIHGATILVKTYGPLHGIYLIYLLSYFAAMILSLIYALLKKKISSPMQAVIIIISVFVNIVIWLFEQMTNFNFEFLSISYIISELFLLSLYLFIQDTNQKLQESLTSHKKNATAVPLEISDEQIQYFKENISSLTPTETLVFHHYLNGKSTKEILSLLNIKENTLKYHNKNIYCKLGVSSRKQMMEIAKRINL